MQDKVAAKINNSFLEFSHVYKRYKSGEDIIVANNDISFAVNEGEFCVVVGPSGAGKTTVLNILGGMEHADEGHIYFDGKDIVNLNDKQLTDYRRYDIGFVFQFYNLMPNLTALENVEIAKELSKSSLDSKEVLEEVGLIDRINHFPAQLSGGEQQRVSIARAIAKNAKLLLCDEPTGALDYVTGKQVLKLLHDLCKKNNKTVILITHNQAITKMADRVINIKNGQITANEINLNPIPIEDIEW